MIPGYNHNVKYKDRVYHVQTEDSGVANPHIITHLFVGGNIVESRKTSYAELVGQSSMNAAVVDLMQGQHKGMLKDLIGGRFDEKIAQRSVNAATLNGPAPLNVDAGAQHRTSFGLPSTPATPAAATAASDNAITKPNHALPPVPPPTPPAAPLPQHDAPPLRTQAPATPSAPRAPVPPPTTPPQAPARPTPAPPAGAPRQPAPGSAAATFAGFGQPAAPKTSDPPTFAVPPPVKPVASPTGARPLPPPAPIAFAPPSQATEAPVQGAVLEAESLARAFESKDESAVDSIFGEDLISEKSLDEVILSYLADDLSKG